MWFLKLRNLFFSHFYKLKKVKRKKNLTNKVIFNIKEYYFKGIKIFIMKIKYKIKRN
jgi:hypothetical protein